MTMWRSLGRGPGFTIGFYLVTVLLFTTALYTKDATLVASLTAPLGVLCAAYFGAGWLKNREDKRNGAPR